MLSRNADILIAKHVGVKYTITHILESKFILCNRNNKQFNALKIKIMPFLESSKLIFSVHGQPFLL